jgi:hypothetical protein
MKPTTYALIAALTVGAAPVLSATAQQEIGRHTSKPFQNGTPATLAPVRVVAPASVNGAVATQNRPLNNIPVRLDPVRIVASRDGGPQHPVQSREQQAVPQGHENTVVLRVALAQFVTNVAINSK